MPPVFAGALHIDERGAIGTIRDRGPRG